MKNPANIVILYFGCINLISAVLFSSDKVAAIRNRKRVPEIVLHGLELAGGVFFNLILMYFIHHKNRKFSYWIWTWFILIIWVFLLSEKHLFGV